MKVYEIVNENIPKTVYTTTDKDEAMKLYNELNDKYKNRTFTVHVGTHQRGCRNNK